MCAGGTCCLLRASACQALFFQADPNIASRFVIGTRWEIPALDDVKPVFDFLLDLLKRFAFGQWLPALFVAEKLIGVEQLHRIDPPCVDLFHLAFDERTNRVAFQQQFSDPLLVLFGSRYLPEDGNRKKIARIGKIQRLSLQRLASQIYDNSLGNL